MQLNLMCPINNLSYGLVSLNLLDQLDKLGWQISLFPINPGSIEAESNYHDLIRKCVANAKYFNANAPCLRVFHQFSMAESIGFGERIGMYFNEMDKLTPLEVNHLNSLDKVITCSDYAQEAAKNSGVVRPDVYVIPLGYNPDIFKVHRNTITDKVVFLNVGKFEYRKSHDVLADIFSSSFTQQDNVELWMLNTNLFLSKEESDEWINMYTNCPLANKIKIIPRQESQHQIAYLMQNATCGIGISRAEGFNLSILEMMACGVPSIVTNFSGHTQFCNEEISILIEPDGLEEANDGKWFIPGGEINQGNWMKMTDKVCGDIGDAMKWVYNNPEKVKVYGFNCVKHSKEFTWNKMALQLEQILKDGV